MKQLLLLAGFFSALTMFGQNSIPNGNFETWTAITSEIPQNYVWSSNSWTYSSNLPFNVTKSIDAYHGNYSVKMTTEIANGDTFPGIFLNVDPQNGNPATWHGGFAYSQKPSGMRGYYKSVIATPDTGFVMVLFYKAGAMIGQYGYYLYGTHTAYTLFSFNFSPALAQAPDSVIFGAGSSNFGSNGNNSNVRNGSMLKLDSVSFTGVTSQPALFNGDFETWQATTIDKPTSWFFQGSNNVLTGGAYKTSDAKAGSNAIELITYVGQRNNHPVAQAGQISTGWYPNNCNSNCYEQGGYPFAHQIDTLAFWYKYAPSGNTTANVNLNFKKNGNNIWNDGITLYSSTNYLYVEKPFNVGMIPDSVIVDLQSSQWQDSLLSYVGSDLKIDEIHFKSQPLNTGISELNRENNLVIFPNPCKDGFSLKMMNVSASSIEKISIYDLLGNIVQSRMYPNSSMNSSEKFDVSRLPAGSYIIQLNAKEGIYRGKLTKID